MDHVVGGLIKAGRDFGSKGGDAEDGGNKALEFRDGILFKVIKVSIEARNGLREILLVKGNFS
ncbi:hypothetical protein GJ744_005711 [Endocarpon pusillum]|uniref:Uncharacterized protein n=1 Tax=Endocarpon pusillum TaxID=364733 RepID=A0A8H7E8M1_9EURO|nr:hypothetical protein GJ744_005711 [Endocarpon pusillum]